MPEVEEARLTLAQVRAIALPTRLCLLQALAERRCTVTELAKRTSVPWSSAKKHLEALERAGLTRSVKDSHKWVYWELLPVARELAKHRPLRVLILTGLFVGVASGLAAVLIAWRDRVKYSQTPWHVPPIGVPVIPLRDVLLIVILAVIAVASLGVALAAWWRSRPAREKLDVAGLGERQV